MKLIRAMTFEILRHIRQTDDGRAELITKKQCHWLGIITAETIDFNCEICQLRYVHTNQGVKASQLWLLVQCMLAFMPVHVSKRSPNRQDVTGPVIFNTTQN